MKHLKKLTCALLALTRTTSPRWLRTSLLSNFPASRFCGLCIPIF